jgi:hypothetical protein
VSSRLTARLVIGGTIAWSFIPVLDVAAFAIVRRRAGSLRSFRRDLDLVSRGWRPWAIILTATASVAAFLTPLQINDWAEAPATLAVLAPLAAGVALRSGYLDFRFYREALDRAPGAAVRDVLLHRAISWTAAAAYFGGNAGWPLLADWIGL